MDGGEAVRVALGRDLDKALGTGTIGAL